MTEKWIWFDMDGTFVDFYGVNGWLDCLLAHDVKPYVVAKDLYALGEFFETLYVLKKSGYKLGVISWSSKENNAEFDKLVAKAKLDWLAFRSLNKLFDEIIVTPYGVHKADTCRAFGTGILVDDEKPNRDAWDLGRTINANENILIALKKLIK